MGGLNSLKNDLVKFCKRMDCFLKRFKAKFRWMIGEALFHPSPVPVTPHWINVLFNADEATFAHFITFLYS